MTEESRKARIAKGKRGPEHAAGRPLRLSAVAKFDYAANTSSQESLHDRANINMGRSVYAAGTIETALDVQEVLRCDYSMSSVPNSHGFPVDAVGSQAVAIHPGLGLVNQKLKDYQAGPKTGFLL